jgi:hypothetical protein
VFHDDIPVLDDRCLFSFRDCGIVHCGYRGIRRKLDRTFLEPPINHLVELTHTRSGDCFLYSDRHLRSFVSFDAYRYTLAGLGTGYRNHQELVRAGCKGSSNKLQCICVEGQPAEEDGAERKR